MRNKRIILVHLLKLFPQNNDKEFSYTTIVTSMFPLLLNIFKKKKDGKQTKKNRENENTGVEAFH